MREATTCQGQQVAQEQYKSLLTGLQAVGQLTGWKVHQIVFVGGTCGSIHVEFEGFGDKARPYFEQTKGASRSKGGTWATARAGNMSPSTCMCEESARTVIE